MMCPRLAFSSRHVTSVSRSIYRRYMRTVHTSCVTSCVRTDLSKLSTKKFWQKKYTEKNFTKKPFDWFTGSDAIIDTIKAEITGGDVARILDVGCGTSSLPGDLYTSVNNPLEIHCLDFIPEALFQQQHWITQSTPRHSLTSSHFLVANVCALPWRRDSFDVIVDKGTMDALVKDRGAGRERCGMMMRELHRVMDKDGVVIQVSDEGPELRLELLEKLSSPFFPGLHWTARLLDVFGDLEYFMYVGRIKS